MTYTSVIKSALQTFTIGDRSIENADQRPHQVTLLVLTRMWANAQRDGRPAEYRWRPLFNAAKFG